VEARPPNRLPELRRQLCLRQSDVAKLSGIALRTVVSVERGARRPTIRTQLRLLLGLGLSHVDRAAIFPETESDWARELPEPTPSERIRRVHASALVAGKARDRSALLVVSPAARS
jgi:transcriptional regulator with XRE-family HTH domain